MSLSLRASVSEFGALVHAKLTNLAAEGEPEDQLRAPLESLFSDLAELCRLPRSAVVAIGETGIAEFHTRPDYAISVRQTLVGHVEVKAPGKGADPRKFRGHDKAQWEKLQSLPNLIYTDGSGFSLWRSGELVEIVPLIGDVRTAGAKLDAPTKLLTLFDSFFQWEPITPRDAKQLAATVARLCRLLRAEAAEQLGAGSPVFTSLAADWRRAFFPDATDSEFADGYAQAVTFGLLMARARGIQLADGLDQAARQLNQTNSLIGTALHLLTFNADNQATLKTSLSTLVRVLDAVHWPTISKGDPEAWLYFYEDFLAVYDNDLRKQTGSYYTPPQVVNAMVRLVDDALRGRFGLPEGLASPSVAVADPAVGTGTFPLGILKRIADRVASDQGEGAVPGAIESALGRLIGFELQLGPFAVAQVRVLAELADLLGLEELDRLVRDAAKTPLKAALRLFVTDTLGNPYVEEEWLPGTLGPIAEARRQANAIKKHERITVVIGNPPYKEKAKGRGGWVESGAENSRQPAPLDKWMPPVEWGVSAHAKHLRNLYVYFWRWATWKVFENSPGDGSGIVCFITVAGFLNGPGFQRMRDDLRRTADDIWVIDCSPEGHQPDVPTRIFQGVQQPVCIVLASRSPQADPGTPARVRFRSLPVGDREAKFAALARLSLDEEGWVECPTAWRAPFLPAAVGAWATYPALDDLFLYSGSGVMPGRTWIISPDADSLLKRWQVLIDTPAERMDDLFVPHPQGDRHSQRVVPKGLPGHEARLLPVARDRGPCIAPVRYGFRSFDRHWIIPDNRLINRPNPTLWEWHSARQVHLTALARSSPSSGPALTFTGLIPDLDHYRGSFGGRAFPLWRDGGANDPNIPPGVLAILAGQYVRAVSAEEVMAYIAAIAAHPAYTARFAADLAQPGLRIPFTADAATFAEATDLGREVIWLHTFGEQFADPARGRPAGPPRLAPGDAPRIPADGAIPRDPAAMPDAIGYDATARRLLVGRGYVENVPPGVWSYEVSGKQVLRQWFSYRKRNRDRPIMGDRRPPSKLGNIQPDHWLPEYTTELLNVLHVLGRLIALEPAQSDLLEKVCAGPTIAAEELRASGALAPPPGPARKPKRASHPDQPSLLD